MTFQLFRPVSPSVNIQVRKYKIVSTVREVISVFVFFTDISSARMGIVPLLDKLANTIFIIFGTIVPLARKCTKRHSQPFRKRKNSYFLRLPLYARSLLGRQESQVTPHSCEPSLN